MSAAYNSVDKYSVNRNERECALLPIINKNFMAVTDGIILVGVNLFVKSLKADLKITAMY